MVILLFCFSAVFIIPGFAFSQGGGVGQEEGVCSITIEPPCLNFYSPPHNPCSSTTCQEWEEWNEATEEWETVMACYYHNEKYVVATSVRKLQDIVPPQWGWNKSIPLPDKQCGTKRTCDCEGRNVGQSCNRFAEVHDPAGDVPQLETVEIPANICGG